MDDAKKLLDALMGGARNADKKEAKRLKGQQFKEDNVCKLYLVGCCPQYEELFHNTRRDIGACTKVHSDAMKEEMERHPDAEKYKIEYERRLKYYLEDLVRTADDWAAKERRNIRTENQQLEASGPGELAKAEIRSLKEEAQGYLDEAEKLAEKGQFDASKEKIEQAEEVKKKAVYFEEKATAAKAENVCEMCGSRKETDDAAYRHEDGKIHIGCVKIRGWLTEYKKKLEEREERYEKARKEKRDGDKDGKESAEGSDRRGRSRSAKRDDRRSDRDHDRSYDRGRRDGRDRGRNKPDYERRSDRDRRGRD